MYKYAKAAAFVASLAWLAFIYSAFAGFHFWYAGFVFFFWLSLAALNYRHDTTLWLLKNRTWLFFKFFVVLVVIGFLGDWVVGQHLAHLWSYPYYRSADAWFRLYLFIYPLGGLCLLELMFFLANLFHERFVFTRHAKGRAPGALERAYRIIDVLFLMFILGLFFASSFHAAIPYTEALIYGALVWALFATFAFAYYVRHGLHWLAVWLTVLVVSIFLHEIPNTAVYEWKYYDAPFLNTLMLGVPEWVFVGWYVMLLILLRLWVHFVWGKRH